jgi:hypothetical protein
MNTQYLTLILRLRLEDGLSQDTGSGKVNGSLQQVGMQEIRYFDTVEKLQEALQGLVNRKSLPAQEDQDDSEKKMRKIKPL